RAFRGGDLPLRVHEWRHIGRPGRLQQLRREAPLTQHDRDGLGVAPDVAPVAGDIGDGQEVRELMQDRALMCRAECPDLLYRPTGGCCTRGAHTESEAARESETGQ